MANNRNDELQRKINESRRLLQQSLIEHQHDCTHNPQSNAKVKPLFDSDIKFPGKDKLPDSTVICEGCDVYFESSSYLQEEVESKQYMQKSMIEQVKFQANLSAEDKEFLATVYDAASIIERFDKYYLNMVKKLANGNGNKNKSKGAKRDVSAHIGVQPGMYSRRNY